jgi:hypothetical protein
MNTQLNSSLDGNLATNSPNDADDLYSTMSLAQQQNYASILAQYSSNITPRTVQLTEVELDALLQQRLSTLTAVKNQVDISGNNYVQGYLASIQKGYSDLQKAQSGNVKPGPNVMSSVPSS